MFYFYAVTILSGIVVGDTPEEERLVEPQELWQETPLRKRGS